MLPPMMGVCLVWERCVKGRDEGEGYFGLKGYFLWLMLIEICLGG